MKKELLVVNYWRGKLEGLDYEHGLVMKYSKKKFDEIINNVLSCGYKLQISQVTNIVNICVDKYNFKQM